MKTRTILSRRYCIGDEPIFVGDRLVGNTTSGGYGFTVNKSVAVGYLVRDLCKDGQQVEIQVLNERLKATVHTRPLVDTEPDRERKLSKVKTR